MNQKSQTLPALRRIQTGRANIASCAENKPAGSGRSCASAVSRIINDHAKLPDLECFPEWKQQPPVLLDTAWPD